MYVHCPQCCSIASSLIDSCMGCVGGASRVRLTRPRKWGQRVEWSENESKNSGKQSEVKETMVMLSHAILVLCKGCDTLLTSARPPHSPLSFTLPWTYSDLTTPVRGYLELCTTLVFDHTYLYTLPTPGLLCACVYWSLNLIQTDCCPYWSNSV